MQFGPTSRSRYGLAARKRRRRQRALVSAASMPAPGPEDMTTATLVPRCPRSMSNAGIDSAGVMITARSGTEASSESVRSTGRPAMVPPLRLTRWMSPLKPPSSRFLVTAAPTDPARSLAPIATTDCGAISLSRLRMDMALEERRSVHQDKARNDDKSCGDPAQSEWFAEQQRAHQSAKQHRGLAQGCDMGHRAQHQGVDRDAVTRVGDHTADHAAPPGAPE